MPTLPSPFLQFCATFTIVLIEYLKELTRPLIIIHRKEKERLEKQKALVEAKIENLKSVQRNEELLEKAIEAMRIYGGRSNEEE